MVYYLFYTEMDTLEVFKEYDLIYNKRVQKKGRTTGTTYGNLYGIMASAKIQRDPLSNNYCILNDLYIVSDIPGNPPFFRRGDSGSGVLVVGNPIKALGIAIAISDTKSLTLVCKINKIVESQQLKIKQKRQGLGENTASSTTLNNLEQNMEWTSTFI